MSKKLKKIHLYSKLLGFLIKKGKTSAFKKALDESLRLVSLKSGYSAYSLLITLFCRLNTFVEVRSVNIRRRLYVVPFTVNFNRRCFLAVKWFMQAVKLDGRKISLKDKLATELYRVCYNIPTYSVQLKNKNLNKALQNRANKHFRW